MPLIQDNESNSEGVSIEKAFKKSGGLGQFHSLMFITLVGCLVTGEIYNSLIMYFNKVPDMICTMKDGQQEPCDWETACNSDD